MAILAFPSSSILDATASGRSLLTAANASTQRSLLGLGTTDSPNFAGLTAGTNFTVDATGNVNFAGSSNLQINRTNDTVGNNSINLANAFGLQITSTNSNLQINRRTGGVWSNVLTFANSDGAAVLSSMLTVAERLAFSSVAAQPRLRRNGNSLDVVSNDELSFSTFRCGSLSLWSDVILVREGQDILSLQRSTNFQTFRAYNTFTDSSNYERGKLEWASNEFRIGTEAAGTGTVRSLRLQVGTATAFYYQSVYGNIGIGTTGYGSSNYGSNIAIGDAALGNTSQNNGQSIVAIGAAALRYLDVANSTDAAVAVGSSAGNRLRAATRSVLVGGEAGFGAVSFNARITNTTCIGYQAGAGFDSTTITDNTCIGYRAGFAVSTGSNNTLLGSLAGDSITTGANNIAIGRDCDVDSATASNQINIGNQYYHNRAFLYNTFTDASNYERGKLEWSSNVLRIGTEKAGTGSARALELQTDGATRVTVSSSAPTIQLGTGASPPSIYSHSGSAISSAGNGSGLTLYRVSGASDNEIGIGVYSNSSTLASGFFYLMELQQTFAPTSGTGTYVAQRINTTINQTGGANGITRGLYINPTLTSAADFRAIEVSAGITVLAASTTSKASLNIPSGTAPTSPANGDIWFDGTDLKIRIGGVTKTVTVT